jgi:hypothetical protein
MVTEHRDQCLIFEARHGGVAPRQRGRVTDTRQWLQRLTLIGDSSVSADARARDLNTLRQQIADWLALNPTCV